MFTIKAFTNLRWLLKILCLRLVNDERTQCSKFYRVGREFIFITCLKCPIKRRVKLASYEFMTSVWGCHNLRYLCVDHSLPPALFCLFSCSNLVSSSVLCLFSASWRHRSCILLIKIPSSRVSPCFLCAV